MAWPVSQPCAARSLLPGPLRLTSRVKAAVTALPTDGIRPCLVQVTLPLFLRDPEGQPNRKAWDSTHTPCLARGPVPLRASPSEFLPQCL